MQPKSKSSLIIFGVVTSSVGGFFSQRCVDWGYILWCGRQLCGWLCSVRSNVDWAKVLYGVVTSSVGGHFHFSQK